MTGKGRKGFEVHSRRSQVAMEGILKVTGEGSVRNEKGCRVFPEKTIITYRVLVKMWMVKAILMGSQTAIRNMLLDNGRVVALVIKRQRRWFNYVSYFSVCGSGR